jgi:hypothetical protein
MYVIQDKKTKTVLHMAQSVPGETPKPEQIFPSFDPKTMLLGRSATPAIPAWFTIEDGVVKEVEPPAVEAQAQAKPAPSPSLDQVKQALIAAASRLAFEKRRELIPDHEQQNAALGVYDDKRTQTIRDTVKAFRSEYKRYEAAVLKAKSINEVHSLPLNYPTKLDAAASGAPRKADKEKKP